jgi:hypothetical protein
MQRCVGASPLPATLERIFGGPAVCRGAGARILPPERPVPGAGAMGTPQGYVSWHRDWSTRDGEVRGDPRPDLKLFILVQDVAGIDQAPTAIVPGSHLVPFGAGQLQHDVGRLFGGYGYGRGDHQSRMPNALAFVAPAGSALLMDTRTWCARTVAVLHPFPLQTDASAVRIPWWACIGTLRTQIYRTRTAGMSSRCFNQRRRTILRSPTAPRRRPRLSCERGLPTYWSSPAARACGVAAACYADLGMVCSANPTQCLVVLVSAHKYAPYDASHTRRSVYMYARGRGPPPLSCTVSWQQAR